MPRGASPVPGEAGLVARYLGFARAAAGRAGNQHRELAEHFESDALLALLLAVRTWDGRGELRQRVEIQVHRALIDTRRAHGPRSSWTMRKIRAGQDVNPTRMQYAYGALRDRIYSHAEDPAPSPESTVSACELAQLVAKVLDPRSAKILLMRADGYPQSEIGAQLGVGGDRVCQIERLAREAVAEALAA